MAVKIQRETHTIDAAGRPAGRLASQISRLLIGKHKAAYLPNVDMGDFVEVVHVDQMSFSGKKLEQAEFKHHTGYQGGLKRTPVKRVFKERPAEVLRHAVSRMLPKNRLRTSRLKRLKMNAG